ncbi:MAG: ATP-dependent zinc metalloprotease FtsH 4 [Candidatus Thorarchaeota archaeon AB_25]|nr:MAG: ATP-dependent zinc metalloprotease FtsH 4 [Candidatus Thorarchaeota archaeon AB_25]
MGEDRDFIETVTLTTPEQVPTERVSQYSVVNFAMEFLQLLRRYDVLKAQMSERGLEFGGKVLLIGPPGSDFGAFPHFLAREVPIKIVRFKMEGVLDENKRSSDALREGFEFARRSSPALLYIEKLETLAPRDSVQSIVLQDEIKSISWSGEEIITIAATTRPEQVDRELLSLYDRTYIVEGTSIDDRIRVLEQILKDREDLDVSVIAELTDGWGFSDVNHLAMSLFMQEVAESGEMPRENLEELIEQSRVAAFGDSKFLEAVIRKTRGTQQPELSKLSEEYPDDFLDQLYLMAVGEDYAETQRVIEVLNEGLPLSVKDREFLSRHPFLLTGSAEDRLTRLLRAKKSSDRLHRIMGRQ